MGSRALSARRTPGDKRGQPRTRGSPGIQGVKIGRAGSPILGTLVAGVVGGRGGMGLVRQLTCVLARNTEAPSTPTNLNPQTQDTLYWVVITLQCRMSKSSPPRRSSAASNTPPFHRIKAKGNLKREKAKRK